jgi:hypothetical protein
VLTAKLLGDISVAVGDYVETVVDEASGGRYVLRVIDISRQMPFGSEGDAGLETLTAKNQSVRAQALLNTLAMLKNNPGADPKAAAFLARHGLAGSAENMETLSQMAKSMAPVTALLAEVMKIFGAVKQPAAPMTQTAQSAASADTLPLTQTAQTAVNAEAAGQNPVSADGQIPAASQPAQQTQNPAGSVNTNTTPGNTAPQTEVVQAAAPNAQAPAQPVMQPAVPETSGTAGQSSSQTMQPSAQPAAADAAAPQSANATPEPMGQNQNAAGQAATPNQTNAQAVSEPAQTVSTTANTVENPAATPELTSDTAIKTNPLDAAVKNAADTVKADAPLNEAQGMITAAAGEIDKAAELPKQQDLAGIPKDMPRNEQIADKALAMFVDLADADELALHLKKAVQELPEQLKELKLLIEHTDNTVKDTVAAKFDQIEKQLSMMNEVKRFDCYQIPLQNGSQQQAAELYVYRYRGGKKTVDPENILILLGLDTQYMGRVETLIKTSGKSLGIEFNLEDMRLGDEMKADAAHLEQAVKDAGYQLTGVSVQQLAARTTLLNAQERFEKEAGGSAGNVDVRI